MPWQQLKIQLKSEHIAFVEQQLLEQGALSVTYTDAKDQPIFQREPGSTPLWDESILVCLFEVKLALDELIWWLQHNPVIINRDSLAIQIIEDQAWERSWMADFQAMQFGQRLWICPSWQSPPDPDAVNIILDPGLAFGSGSHATTAMCLQWLEQANLRGERVIDYGCGSGVLAIAAALLGARSVIAVDNDPQAITATIDNCKRNGLGQYQISTFLPELMPVGETDILLANILAEPLIELAGKFASLLKAKGKLVLSGLLQEQTAKVVSAYENWFEMDTPVTNQEWVRLSGTRNARALNYQ